MPRLLSPPVLIASVLVLGIARGCWYYLYLEPPETYYERICACGVSLKPWRQPGSSSHCPTLCFRLCQTLHSAADRRPPHLTRSG